MDGGLPTAEVNYLIGAVIVRRGQSILLVHQVIESGEVGWSLPGGVIEEDENVRDGAIREVLEETGVSLAGQVMRLAYVVSYSRSEQNDRTKAFVFEVETAEDVIMDNVDSDILSAEFAPMELALERLGDFPLKVMVQPAIAFLTGEAPHGTSWSYAEDDKGVQIPSRTFVT
jgi:8-oxo-dGTP diphosphatase